MGAFLNLSAIALREVVCGALQRVGGEKVGATVIDLLCKHYTDHSLTLTKALKSANDRAWKAVEIALGGESFWEKCVRKLASAEDQAFRDQVRTFLNNSPLTKAGVQHAETFRRALTELQTARSRKLLEADDVAPAQLARDTEVFARFHDPRALLEAEWQAVERTAGGLRETCPTLYTILVDRTQAAGGPSILAIAVRYFFRREIENNTPLFQGLLFTQVKDLDAAQQRGFEAIASTLDQHGQRITELVISLDSRIGGLEDMIQELLGRLQLQNRPVRQSDSLSICGDAELRLVRQVVELYRLLPDEQKASLPGLLNSIGKVKVAAGDFPGAHDDFVAAAAGLQDPRRQAEAHYNAYRAALEQGQWDSALKEIRQAATLDPSGFEPFPLHHYEPQRILGAGGFGTVYLCRDAFVNAQVVIKALHDGEIDRRVEDVFAEAQALSTLNHSAIIGVRHCDYADNRNRARPYIVMPYFAGVSLAQFVQQRGTLSPDQLIAVARQIAEGMKEAHARNILHRDLKPENILVRKEGDAWHVKIIDFGLAVNATGATGGSSSANSIRGQSVAGTLKYAPPEQLGEMSGIKPGPYSDVYSFGKTCWYALFKTTTPLMSHWNKLPSHLAELLNGCLQEDLEYRHKNFDAVLLGIINTTEKVQCDNCHKVLKVVTKLIGKQVKCPKCGEVFVAKPIKKNGDTEMGSLNFEQDLKDALEQWRAAGSTRAYFSRQGPIRIALWQSAAENADPHAQWLFARCLQEGTGVKRNAQAGAKWLRQAAQLGLPAAQCSLGDCYFDGVGIKANGAEAFRRYSTASEQGFGEAQKNLGVCYEDGVGVRRNFTVAAQWYRKAADQGWAEAQDYLGSCYLYGTGVEQDYSLAVHWYRKAATQGFPTALYNLAYCYEQGKGIKADLSEAVKLYRNAADHDMDALFSLAYCYEHGRGVERDITQAKQWYSKSAERGNKQAANAVARLEFAGPPPKPVPSAEKGYWVIAPYSSDDAQHWQRVWQFDLANNVISIGWEWLDDISSLDEQRLRAAIDRTDTDATAKGKGMCFRMLWDFFHSIKLGDVIIARQGTKKLAAVGTVIRTAYYDPLKMLNAVGDWFTFAYHLDVRWEDTPRDKVFSEIVFGMQMQTLTRSSALKFRTLVGNACPNIRADDEDDGPIDDDDDGETTDDPS